MGKYLVRSSTHFRHCLSAENSSVGENFILNLLDSFWKRHYKWAQRQKVYLRTCVSSKDLDQPAPSRTLIRLRGCAGWFESSLGAYVRRYLFARSGIYVMVRYTSVSRRTIKSTIRLVRPAKTQIRLRIRAVWSESSMIASLLQPLGNPTRDKRELCHTRWMYRLIWVFVGHTGLIVGFVVRWLNYCNQAWFDLC